MSTESGAGGPSLADLGLATDPAVVESLAAAPGIGLVLVGPDETVRWIDGTAVEYFRLPDDQIGADRTVVFNDAVRPCLERPDRSFDQTDGPTDIHVLPEDGRDERWLRYSAVPVTAGRFAGGRVEQFVDVTSEYANERFQQYRQIVETVDEAVFVLDTDYRVDYANPVAQTQIDSSLASITGRPFDSIVETLVTAETDHERVTQALDTVFGESGEHSVTVELQLATSAGPGTYRFDCTAANSETVVATLRNISEHRQRQRRYETLVENFPNGAVTLVDETLTYQLAGGQLFEQLDETPADVEGANVGDIKPGDREVFVESYRDALNGDPAIVETSVEGRTLLLRTLPVYDDDGIVRTAIGMTQDVTERKRREEELRWKSRALDEAPVGITLTDPQQADNPMTYVNKQFGELTGYDSDATLGRNCRFLQGDETDPEAVRRLREAIEGERQVSVELRNYRADGTEFWNQLDIAPVRDESGTVVNYVGFQQDVTDRKEQERQLRDANRLLDIALTETGTGIWVLNDSDDSLTSFGMTTELFDLEPGTHSTESYVKQIHPADRSVVNEALNRARTHGERFDIKFRVDTTDGQQWIHSRGSSHKDEDESDPQVLGVLSDITNQHRRVQALEKRERILNELHTATREFYPPGSLSDIAEFLVEFTDNTFDVDYVSVKQYSEDTGSLEPTARSVSTAAADTAPGAVAPGSGVIWDAYRRGETRLSTETAEIDLPREAVTENTQLLVIPVGDFGVLVAVSANRNGFEDVDIDLFEVLTANAESAFQRLRSDQVHTAITNELSVQQSRVNELNSIIDSVQAIQQRLADSESQEALETGVCEELLGMDSVDFVWVSQPTGKDTDLSASAWAGDGDGYLDSVLTDGPDGSLPAQRAASDHSVYTVGDIPGRVFEDSWAKDALSYGFKSVSSIPLLYDDVLYGVLTVYSQTPDAFDGLCETLFTEVASLMVNYSRILDQRQVGSQRLHTELEFELTDPTYPLQRLAAATETRLRLDTVAERTTDQVRILVTVLDGDAEQVLDRVSSIASIDAAEWFGATEHNQLSLLVGKPFLESVVSKHGARLIESVSEPDGTTLRLSIPQHVSQRPLFDSLTSQYQQIDLVAKRQVHTQQLPDARTIEDLLTDRQCQILNAAFHGGYYQTPRRVRGEDLAESFGISGPAVYKHLQAAHHRLLETVFDSRSETNE